MGEGKVFVVCLCLCRAVRIRSGGSYGRRGWEGLKRSLGMDRRRKRNVFRACGVVIVIGDKVLKGREGGNRMQMVRFRGMGCRGGKQGVEG